MFEAEEGAETAPDINFAEKKTDSEVIVDDLSNQIEATKMQIELEKLNKELEAAKATGTGTGTGTGTVE
jgi:hypothetical protein